MTFFLVEVTQQQKLTIRIEADTPTEAIERVNDQQGELGGDQSPIELLAEKTLIISGG